jgi:decaprenylphospho-beta-D-ribofuranose 2-oxidase
MVLAVDVGGSWCDHVVSLRLLLPSGELAEVSRAVRPDLFWATAGGLGLTGVIVDCTFRCPPIETSRLVVETIRTRDLDEIMQLMRHDDSHYSVAWIDHMAKGRAMGRSVLTRGDFARLDELPRSERHDPFRYEGNVLAAAPPLVPDGLLNHATIRAFNEVWYRKAPRHRQGELQAIPKFFHPLDMIDHWNRAYGSAGFVQWQFALPFESDALLPRIVERLRGAGVPSFVNVLKTFGPSNDGPLSFPLGGWTLAVDIPSATPDLPRVLDRLDDDVAAAGGRIYLAKDSRMRAELVPVMYPRLEEWREVRERVDPGRTLRSDLARRLNL